MELRELQESTIHLCILELQSRLCSLKHNVLFYEHPDFVPKWMNDEIKHLQFAINDL